MKKILLTMFALLVLGGANFAKAEKTYWSPTSPWKDYANCYWDGGKFYWNGTHDVVRAIRTGFTGDLRGYTQFHATVSDLTGDGVNKLQLKVNCTGGVERLIDLSSGENLIDMTDWFTDPSAVTTFELWGPKSSTEACSAVVTDVYIENPEYFVTYVVKDTNGSTIFTSEAQETTLGAHITTLPNQFKRGFCEYTSADVTIENAETTVEFTATWDACPITFYADYTSIEWKNLHLSRSKQWYLNNDPAPCLVGDPSNNDRTADSYQWGFVGNPYRYLIYNKAAGRSKTLNQSAAMADGETFWTSVAKNGKGILFGRASDGQFLNQSGGDGKTTLGFWGDATDAGSTFFVSDVIVYNGFGGEITSLSGITDGTRFVISDDGTKAKYFYNSVSGANENKNANVEDVPADAYCYFTLEKYTGGDVVGDNIYRIKITNAEDEGYPNGTNGGYYLNSLHDIDWAHVVISAPQGGWSCTKDALWYVTYDAEKGFSFQNVCRDTNGKGLKSWLSIDNNLVADQQYLKLYKSINYLNFNNVGTAIIDKKCLLAEGGLTYDSSTGVLTSDGTAGKLVLAFATPVDLKFLNTFEVTRNTSDNDGIISRLRFYDEDGALINTWNGNKLANPGLDNNDTNTFLNNKPVKKMVWESDANTANNEKSFTISAVKFQLKTMSCSRAGETILRSLPWIEISTGDAKTPDWNMNVSTATYYGDYSSNPTHYADLTAYEELRIYRDNNDGFRAFFINAAGNGSNTIGSDNAASTWNAEGKYWSIDLSKIEKWDSKVALKSIKSASSETTNIVTNIIVYNAPAANAPKYILTGSGMQLAETVAALADATATCIDATGVTGITTDSEAGRTLLTSANPNCLFLGTTGNGGLANTQNVITTSGTCDNLVLTDGYPFKAPANFTATAASYATTINTTAKAGTLCLPFAATIPDGVTAYTLSYVSGNDAATATPVDATIPANTPVLLNGSGEVTFSGSSAAVTANASNTAGAMTGVFERTAVPENSYVLQNGKEGLGFYKVASSDIFVNPFRAYLTAEASLANLRIVYDDATAIDEVKTQTAGDDAIYTLTGIRVAQPTKGIYVKNGRKFIVK